MLPIVIGIVSVIGIPIAGEEIALPRYRATLHMHAVDKAMLYRWSAPVAAPDQAAAQGELSEEAEIALPGRLAANHAHDVASQSVVMYAHRAQFGCAIVEERLLALLTAIRFIDHHFNPHLLRRCDQPGDQLAGHGLKQGSVADARDGAYALVFRDYLLVEASDGGAPLR
jgi:hypothetical protein